MVLIPGSDSLKEILNRILVLGNELLNESGIEFSFQVSRISVKILHCLWTIAETW